MGQSAPLKHTKETIQAFLCICLNCGMGEDLMGTERCTKCRCAYRPQKAYLVLSEIGEALWHPDTIVARGICYGHPKFPDGTEVRTSKVLKHNDTFILTYNTLYVLRDDAPPVFPELVNPLQLSHFALPEPDDEPRKHGEYCSFQSEPGVLVPCAECENTDLSFSDLQPATV